MPANILGKNDILDIPANMKALEATFEALESGSTAHLRHFLAQAAYKYQVGMGEYVFRPSLSITEFIDWRLIRESIGLQMFSSMSSHVRKHFKHPKIRKVLEFPVLFLGATPQNTPAMYSMMNYADIKGGTWYPEGGMYAIVQAMYDLAVELGVEFKFNEPVQAIRVINRKATEVVTAHATYTADAVISGADYEHTEQALLAPEYRTYSKPYWKKRVMAPSCLMYYVGLNKKLKNIQHHSLFFDVPFAPHGVEIYKKPGWPKAPLFYVSVSSLTDPNVAPAGHENIVFLIPIASGLEGDTEELREHYFQIIAKRMEQHLGESILDAVVYKKMYSVRDFKADYNSFQGNAYGLANTLLQTAILRPACKSKKVSNLFFTGQLTVPGPGVPPSLISGEVVAGEVIKSLS